MDGLAGLEEVFKELFPQAEVQRCQVHGARNVLAKVPTKLKQQVANDPRAIFYVPSREESLRRLEQFKRSWYTVIPSAVECLKQSMGACLPFFNFPSESIRSLKEDPGRWRSLQVKLPAIGYSGLSA